MNEHADILERSLRKWEGTEGYGEYLHKMILDYRFIETLMRDIHDELLGAINDEHQ